MKSIKILLAAIVFLAIGTVQAQVQKTTTTTSTLPDWGVAGYDNATYYYIPDIETYYDVRTKNYVYMNGDQWVKTTTLPLTYKDYDLYSGYKVVLTDDKEPFAQYDKMKVKYAKGYKGDTQRTIKIKKRANGTVKIKEK